MVRHGRTDANQLEIVRMLNVIPGVSVKVLSDVGDGFTDIIVGRRGVNHLIEIKNGSCLTPAQKNFHGKGGTHPEREWKGQKAVANCLEDALKIIGIKQF